MRGKSHRKRQKQPCLFGDLPLSALVLWPLIYYLHSEKKAEKGRNKRVLNRNIWQEENLSSVVIATYWIAALLVTSLGILYFWKTNMKKKILRSNKCHKWGDLCLEEHGQRKCHNSSWLQNQKLMTQIHLYALNIPWLKVNHINYCESTSAMS